LAQTIYAVLGLGASGGAAFFGWTRVKQRRRTLHQTLKEADETYAASKHDPQPGIERLVGLKAELATRHQHSKVEDSHFLELDRRISDYIAKLRIIDMELKYPDLPHPLFEYIQELLKDGSLSHEDIKRIDARAVSLKMPLARRKQFLAFLTQYSPQPILVTA
jgi:hypothetical protein